MQQNLNHGHQAQKNVSNQTQAGQIIVTYYTDPLCCWSWGFEKTWKKMLADFSGRIVVRYIMGVMIKDWASFNDAYNCVSNPIQMGPLWMQAAQVTHTPIDHLIWHKDPPSSSYPACLAVKTVFLQSQEAGANYFSKVQEAVMTRLMNISKDSVLLELAKELSVEMNDVFDLKKFEKDWATGRAKTSLDRDRQQAMLNKIGRYPTITITNDTGKGIMMVGYRPYEVLLEGLKVMGLTPQENAVEDERVI